ncbi:MAG: class I SAM-dependent methyltransferase [Deltaproteobacteria bacterium]|nr:class I SAM-dependent methyltransferase [Deltaproteobacteria bacterium]
MSGRHPLFAVGDGSQGPSSINNGSIPAHPTGGNAGNGSGNGNSRTAITMNTRYHDGLVEFKRRCTDYLVIETLIDHLFETDAYGINAHLNGIENPKVADLGCGDGTITSKMIRTIAAKIRSRVTYDVVEPLKQYIESASNRIRSENAESQSVDVCYYNQKAEDHFALPNKSRYDMVFASHSLHLVPLTALRDLVGSMKPGGYLVVVIGARHSVMSVLKDLFVEQPAITGADIISTLAGLNKRSQFEMNVESWPSTLSLDDIELPDRFDELDEKTKNILSLMVQKNIDEVGQEGYTLTRNHILPRLVNGRLRLDNDCIVLRRK